MFQSSREICNSCNNFFDAFDTVVALDKTSLGFSCTGVCVSLLSDWDCVDCDGLKVSNPFRFVVNWLSSFRL